MKQRDFSNPGTVLVEVTPEMERKERSRSAPVSSAGSTLTASWNSDVDELDPKLIPEDKREALLESQRLERQKSMEVSRNPAVIKSSPPRVIPQGNHSGFGLNRLYRADIFHWLKESPRGWADVVVADPTIWRDRGTSWSTDLGFERTRQEYEGRLYSLCAEFARLARNTGHLFLLQTDKPLKLKGLGWHLIEDILPSIGDHKLSHYCRGKFKASSTSCLPCDLVSVEGYPYTVIDPYCIQELLKSVGQEGSNVFSPFAGSGSICRKAKELGMFYVGVEKEDYSPFWKDL